MEFILRTSSRVPRNSESNSPLHPPPSSGSVYQSSGTKPSSCCFRCPKLFAGSLCSCWLCLGQSWWNQHGLNQSLQRRDKNRLQHEGTQWGPVVCQPHVCTTTFTSCWFQHKNKTYSLTSASPVYSLDTPEDHAIASLLNPPGCFQLHPALSAERGWTSELRPKKHSPSLTNNAMWRGKTYFNGQKLQAEPGSAQSFAD